jgi:hypothetical protein
MGGLDAEKLERTVKALDLMGFAGDDLEAATLDREFRGKVELKDVKGEKKPTIVYVDPIENAKAAKSNADPGFLALLRKRVGAIRKGEPMPAAPDPFNANGAGDQDPFADAPSGDSIPF